MCLPYLTKITKRVIPNVAENQTEGHEDKYDSCQTSNYFKCTCNAIYKTKLDCLVAYRLFLEHVTYKLN